MPHGPRVVAPPPRPLLVFDGDCGFCRHWIRRWQQMTGAAVDYLPAQDGHILAQFPEIPRAQFDASVQLIETDGEVFSGAEAVIRTLTYGQAGRWPLRVYQWAPAFAKSSEWAYRLVASHRVLFSRLTRWL